MARKIINSVSTNTLANTQDLTKLQKAAIIPITSDGKADSLEDIYFLELNPASYEETKSSRWIQQETSGSSDPTLQWMGGGVRTVSFEALVTKDIHKQKVKTTTDKLKDLGNKYANSAISAVGGIASKIAGVNLPIGALASLLPTKPINSDLSINANLLYYRSLLYPEHSTDGKLKQAPPLVYLALNTTLGEDYIAPNTKIKASDGLWVLTDLKINITKQLPSLEPMEATVAFTFIQYAIKSFNRSEFI